jgi:hypothetical protein
MLTITSCISEEGQVSRVFMTDIFATGAGSSCGQSGIYLAYGRAIRARSRAKKRQESRAELRLLVVEPRGLEPLTPCLQSRCATNCAKAPSRES